jgi:hypothetical protein
MLKIEHQTHWLLKLYANGYPIVALENCSHYNRCKDTYSNINICDGKQGVTKNGMYWCPFWGNGDTLYTLKREIRNRDGSPAKYMGLVSQGG